MPVAETPEETQDVPGKTAFHLTFVYWCVCVCKCCWDGTQSFMSAKYVLVKFIESLFKCMHVCT